MKMPILSIPLILIPLGLAGCGGLAAGNAAQYGAMALGVPGAVRSVSATQGHGSTVDASGADPAKYSDLLRTAWVRHPEVQEKITSSDGQMASKAYQRAEYLKATEGDGGRWENSETHHSGYVIVNKVYHNKDGKICHVKEQGIAFTSIDKMTKETVALCVDMESGKWVKDESMTL
jgi:surface antigen